MKKTIFLFVIIASSFHSCKKVIVEEFDLGLEFAPQTIGSYIIYNVTHIKIDDAVSLYDTSIYQLKEKIESQFIDNQGRPSLRIERYWRTNDTLPWTIKDVWYSTRTNYGYEKVEENERFLKLEFPIKLNKEWNGNTFNTRTEWDYFYEWIEEPHTIGGNTFGNTIRVMQRDNFNFVEYELAWEIYAENVGLIQKQLIDLDINNGNTNDVQRGELLYQNLVSYGVE